MNLLFDIGGTQLRIASADKKSVKEVLFFDAAPSFKENLEIFKLAIKQLGLTRIDLAVGGVPRFAQDKLTIWHTNPTAKVLNKITGSKVILENDAALAGLAEATIGAGKNKPIVGFLTVSTGFGGALITNGSINANHFGYEPKLEMTDNFSSISKLITGRSIKKRFHQNAENITDKKAWKQIENSISLAVNNAAVFWSPDVIVLGGPVALNKNISITNIQKTIDKNFKGMPATPKVVPAKLDQLAGIYGAFIRSQQ